MHSDLNVKKTNIGAREIHDRNTFTMLRVTNRHHNNDIRRLCTGWIATYHVWKLENPGCPAAKIEMPLDADDILHPVNTWTTLSQMASTFPWQLDLTPHHFVFFERCIQYIWARTNLILRYSPTV